MEVSQNQVNEFQSAFCPFGYRDIEVVISNYLEAGKSIDELVEAIEEFSNDMGVVMNDIDVCYVAFDTLYQEARTEIESATGKDISNDEPFSAINIYGNYMCTSIDGTDEDREALKKLIDTMKEKSEVVQWVYNNL